MLTYDVWTNTWNNQPIWKYRCICRRWKEDIEMNTTHVMKRIRIEMIKQMDEGWLDWWDLDSNIVSEAAARYRQPKWLGHFYQKLGDNFENACVHIVAKFGAQSILEDIINTYFKLSVLIDAYLGACTGYIRYRDDNHDTRAKSQLNITHRLLNDINDYVNQNISNHDERNRDNHEIHVYIMIERCVQTGNVPLLHHTLQVCKHICDYGGDYKSFIRWKNNGLCLACQYGYVDMVRILLNLNNVEENIVEENIVEENIFKECICNAISNKHIEVLDILYDNTSFPYYRPENIETNMICFHSQTKSKAYTQWLIRRLNVNI